MQKYCFVIPSLQPGGTERVMAELVRYFCAQKNIELHLILYGKSRKNFYAIPPSVKLHKPSFPFDSSRRTYSTLKTMLFLRKTIKNIQPRAVLSLGEYWNSLILLSLFGLKFPVFISDRCQPDKHLGKLHELLREWLYPKAAGIIAQTKTAKTIYQNRQLNRNISIIGNPIRKLAQSNGNITKENIILTVGRLIETKNHDRLIRIFKNLNLDDWKLVIVGGDALKQNGMERLKDLVRKMDLEDKVILTGNVKNVEHYYLKSKIFAFTSSSEGFPNVIGEAMAAGLPVVAYDCVAGPSDLINDGENGFLVNLFDDVSFENKLKKLIVDDKLRKKMGKLSKSIIKKYSVPKIANKYSVFINNHIYQNDN